MHNLRDPQISFFNKIFIKNGSHDTIHTFKNYFAIMLSVFSKISSIQTHPKCIKQVASLIAPLNRRAKTF